MITEATVATQPLPKHRGVVLLLFDRLESAAKAVMEILPLRPSACDLMDRRHLSLARESTVQYDLLIPPETEAALLVEQDGDTLARRCATSWRRWSIACDAKSGWRFTPCKRRIARKSSCTGGWRAKSCRRCIA